MMYSDWFFLQREHSDTLANKQLPDLADALQELEENLLQFSSDSVQNEQEHSWTRTLYRF